MLKLIINIFVSSLSLELFSCHSLNWPLVKTIYRFNPDWAGSISFSRSKELVAPNKGCTRPNRAGGCSFGRECARCPARRRRQQWIACVQCDYKRPTYARRLCQRLSIQFIYVYIKLTRVNFSLMSTRGTRQNTFFAPDYDHKKLCMQIKHADWN